MAVEGTARGKRAAENSSASLPWWVEPLKLVATGAVASLATIAVGYMTFSNTSRELDIRMVDVSLSILSGDKTGVSGDRDSREVDEYFLSRLFALRALTKYSGVPIPPEEMESWARSGSISFGEVPTSNWTDTFDKAFPSVTPESAPSAPSVPAVPTLEQLVESNERLVIGLEDLREGPTNVRFLDDRIELDFARSQNVYSLQVACQGPPLFDLFSESVAKEYEAWRAEHCSGSEIKQ